MIFGENRENHEKSGAECKFGACAREFSRARGEIFPPAPGNFEKF